jgi:hypothetical protein
MPVAGIDIPRPIRIPVVVGPIPISVVIGSIVIGPIIVRMPTTPAVVPDLLDVGGDGPFE